MRKGEFDLGDEVAALVVAQERLGARRRELHRAAQLARRPQREAEFHEDAVAGAEITADIVGQNAQPIRRNAEHGGELVLLAHRAAAAGMQRVAAARRVVFGERRSRLERHAGDTVDMEVHGDDVIGAGEGTVGRLLVAERRVDRHIARRLRPHHRCARLHGIFGMEDERQNLVVDLDGLGGIERLGLGLRHHHGDGLADMADLVGRQQHMRTEERLTRAGPMQLHVVFGLGQGIVGYWLEPVGKAIGSREYAEHARHGAGAGGIDAANQGVRMGRAHHREIALAGCVEIIAKTAGPGCQPGVLLAGDRPADEAEMRIVCVHGCQGRPDGGASR